MIDFALALGGVLLIFGLAFVFVGIGTLIERHQARKIGDNVRSKP